MVAPSTALEVVIVTVPGCDPYTQLDGCEGGGGGECMTSVPGMDYTTSCPGGGGTGGGTGGTGGGGAGGSVPTTPPTDPYIPAGAFAEGPLAWAGCVLLVIGSGVSIDIVASKFASWWEAQQAFQIAARSLDIAISMQRQGYEIDPNELSLLMYKKEQALQRRDDAVGAVEEATGNSTLALLAAGVGCGAAALLPTP